MWCHWWCFFVDLKIMQQFNYRLRDCRREPSNSHQHNCYIFRLIFSLRRCISSSANLHLLLGTRTTPSQKGVFEIVLVPCLYLENHPRTDGYVVRITPIYLERVFAIGGWQPDPQRTFVFPWLSTTSFHSNTRLSCNQRAWSTTSTCQGIWKSRQPKKYLSAVLGECEKKVACFQMITIRMNR